MYNSNAKTYAQVVQTGIPCCENGSYAHLGAFALSRIDPSKYLRLPLLRTLTPPPTPSPGPQHESDEEDDIYEPNGNCLAPLNCDSGPTETILPYSNIGIEQFIFDKDCNIEIEPTAGKVTAQCVQDSTEVITIDESSQTSQGSSEASDIESLGKPQEQPISFYNTVCLTPTPGRLNPDTQITPITSSSVGTTEIIQAPQTITSSDSGGIEILRSSSDNIGITIFIQQTQGTPITSFSGTDNVTPTPLTQNESSQEATGTYDSGANGSLQYPDPPETPLPLTSFNATVRFIPTQFIQNQKESLPEASITLESCGVIYSFQCPSETTITLSNGFIKPYFTIENQTPEFTQNESTISQPPFHDFGYTRIDNEPFSSNWAGTEDFGKKQNDNRSLSTPSVNFQECTNGYVQEESLENPSTVAIPKSKPFHENNSSSNLENPPTIRIQDLCNSGWNIENSSQLIDIPKAIPMQAPDLSHFEASSSDVNPGPQLPDLSTMPFFSTNANNIDPHSSVVNHTQQSIRDTPTIPVTSPNDLSILEMKEQSCTRRVTRKRKVTKPCSAEQLMPPKNAKIVGNDSDIIPNIVVSPSGTLKAYKSRDGRHITHGQRLPNEETLNTVEDPKPGIPNLVVTSNGSLESYSTENLHLRHISGVFGPWLGSNNANDSDSDIEVVESDNEYEIDDDDDVSPIYTLQNLTTKKLYGTETTETQDALHNELKHQGKKVSGTTRIHRLDKHKGHSRVIITNSKIYKVSESNANGTVISEFENMKQLQEAQRKETEKKLNHNRYYKIKHLFDNTTPDDEAGQTLINVIKEALKRGRIDQIKDMADMMPNPDSVQQLKSNSSSPAEANFNFLNFLE